MNWAKVTSYQALLASLRVVRKRLSKRIPLPQVFTPDPLAFERTELPISELPLEAPADFPACPGQHILCCVQRVLGEKYLLAACMSPLSLEITCR